MKRSFSQAESSSSGSATITFPPQTSSTSQINTIPPLKLRIKQQSIVQELTVSLYESSNVKETLQFLLHFHHQLRLVDFTSEECEQVIRHLKDLIRKESDHLVRAKAIELIKEICYLPSSNKMQCVEEIFDCLHKESNHIVLSQIFSSLSRAAILIPNKADIIQKILKASIKKLDDSHHDVRCACLNMIGQLCPFEPIRMSSTRTVDPMELFSEFSADQDPRVRTVVYQSLLTLHQRNRPLDISVYEKATSALTDDYENVRLAAIKLVWVFSHTTPNSMMKTESGEEIRLLDDAFIKICNMSNDISMKVRAKAVGLLGSLHDVSLHLLQQTLDKKLMSHGKKTKSFNQRQLERFRGGGSSGGGGAWATGTKWASDDPSILKKEIKEDEVKLMNSGSCGVFVKSLEDEFMEVRTAGVDSLCELANQNPSFARMSTDFLVDMFNDEIESVRLNSVNSLMKLHKYVDLREDQLDTILECLNDFNQVVRNAVRDLLAQCQMATQSCLYATVLALLTNLKKYANDRESIWRCMKSLGERHPYFVSSLVPQIFITHPFYAIPEPNIDDPAHIAVSALVFNATVHSPPILSLLPPFAKQHYDYLRESLPEFIPALSKDDSSSSGSNSKDGEEESLENRFFQNTIQRLYNVLEKPSNRSMSEINSCLSDLNGLKKLHRSIRPSAEFLALFFKSYQMLRKCQNERTWNLPPALTASTECSSLQNDVENLLEMSYNMEYSFPGITSKSTCVLRMIRILAHSLHILLHLRALPKAQQTQKNNFKLWKIFFKRLNNFKEHLTTSSSDAHAYQSVIELQNSLEQNLSDITTLLQLVQNFFVKQSITLDMNNRLRQCSATILEPRNNVDNPFRFSAGLVLAVDFVSFIHNIDDVTNVYIKITYPDSQIVYQKPKNTEFHWENRSRQKLLCKLLLSHQSWTEPCFIKVCVVLIHPTDIKRELYHKQSDNQVQRNDELYKSFLKISDEVKIYVQPKPVTR